MDDGHRLGLDALRQPGFAEVGAYALERLRTRGDVYGWGPLEGGDQPRALLLVAPDAAPDSFPEKIAGVRLVIEVAEPLELQAGTDVGRAQHATTTQ